MLFRRKKTFVFDLLLGLAGGNFLPIYHKTRRRLLMERACMTKSRVTRPAVSMSVCVTRSVQIFSAIFEQMV